MQEIIEKMKGRVIKDVDVSKPWCRITFHDGYQVDIYSTTHEEYMIEETRNDRETN